MSLPRIHHDLRPHLGLAARLAALSVLHFVAFVGPIALIAPPAPVVAAHARATAGEPQLIYLLAFSVLNALVIAIPILLSRVRGPRLMVALAVSHFGLQTFMGQIETAWFLDAFPLIDRAELLRLFLRGALTSVLFAPLAVVLLGRHRADDAAESLRPPASWWHRMSRLPLLALGYVGLYFAFGYHVAWRFPEVRRFYTGSEAAPGFIDQTAGLVMDEPSFLPFQFLRGLLWVAFSVPLLLIVRERRASMLVLGASMWLFGAQILLPSAFFPPIVRLAHFLETSTSTALFGLWVGAWLAVEARDAKARGVGSALHAALR